MYSAYVAPSGCCLMTLDSQGHGKIKHGSFFLTIYFFLLSLIGTLRGFFFVVVSWEATGCSVCWIIPGHGHTRGTEYFWTGICLKRKQTNKKKKKKNKYSTLSNWISDPILIVLWDIKSSKWLPNQIDCALGGGGTQTYRVCVSVELLM